MLLFGGLRARYRAAHRPSSHAAPTPVRGSDESRRPRRRRRYRGRAPRDAAARGQGARSPSSRPSSPSGWPSSRRTAPFTHVPRAYAGRPARALLARRRGDRRPRRQRRRRGRGRAPRSASATSSTTRRLCTFIMPAIVDRSPVTIAIGSSGLSPVLARWIKGVIETLLPARLGALAELAGRWRAARARASRRSDRAAALLGARRHGRRRRARVRGPRRRRRARARERALELGQRRRRAARRSVSRRRGPGRHRPDHDPRPPIARDRRRRALRPARERRAPAVRAARRRAHLRRQDAAPAVDLAEAAESPAREPRASRASASAGSRAATRSSSAAAARSSRRSPKPGSSSKSCPAYRRPKAAPRTPAFR